MKFRLSVSIAGLFALFSLSFADWAWALPAQGHAAGEKVREAAGAKETAKLSEDARVREKEAQALPKNLIRVPLVRQGTDYTCGISALQAILAYYGDETREDVLAKALGAKPEEGTSYKEIAAEARARGFDVAIEKNSTIESLETWLRAGKPVICLIQAWKSDEKTDPKVYSTDFDDGHYVVAVGFDERNIYFMDPSTLGNYTYIERQEFLDRWHDRDSGETLHNFAMPVYRSRVRYNPEVALPLR